MTDYIGAITGSSKLYLAEAMRLVGQLKSEATITDGVIRWNSNNAVPPADCVALAIHIGLPVDTARCDTARSDDLTKFLAGYNPVYSEEDLAEMRREFGPNAKVVNVLTGKRIHF